uniref:DUF1616 domain-containing protein n=1 Tax=uncultured euryarchaeote Alv-FOS1 TaxID=337892 RepID=Q3SAD5_9EURY|nr:hypothetical protein [uncultured euryarchaeote Alv-FOS1]
MKDKNIVALITVAALAMYFFVPSVIARFVALGVLLFFAPGFFLLKLLYRDMKLEELVLLSFGVSLGISGAVSVALAALGILHGKLVLGIVALISVAGYALSSSLTVNFKLTRPDKFTVVMLAMMLTLIAVWGSYEYQTTPYRELDIGITAWPHNVTVNSTLNFTIYVANQNYGPANCTVVFYLNSHRLANETVRLTDGTHTLLKFTAHTNVTGKNLASFDLYANGKYYTNVHVYFDVKN